MKLALIPLTVVALALAPTPTSAYDTASTPVMAATGKFLQPYVVTTAVTLDDTATVTVISEALRHPTEIEYAAVLPAGTHTISIRCTSTRLPHTWTVTIDGVRASSASLKCE